MNDKHYYSFDDIEYQRKQLLSSKSKIEMIEMGAGSRKANGAKRSVSDIAKSSLSSAWQCQLLFKLIQHTRPETVLEIGSSFGISTAYLAKANSAAQIYSLEGNPSSLNIARNVARNVQAQNVTLIPGNFDDSLPLTLEKIKRLDLAFIDGNHRKKPTIEYFELMKKRLHEDSIVVFDDIYWSIEMKEAWEEIKKDESVKASLDFFYFGLIFLSPKFKEKKHLKILETKFKPWQKFI